MFGDISWQVQCSSRSLVARWRMRRWSSTSVERFVARRSFPLPSNNSFTWFPGHMLAGLRALASIITDIDLIIETRDARIPLSSRNPYLEDLCASKRRLILYNKRDLAGLTERQEEVRLVLNEFNGREYWDGIQGMKMRPCSRIFMSPRIYRK
jgi:hypothetical protein